MDNYRDLSPPSGDVSAGFQFEFFCQHCGDAHRTAFTPYRRGQITGWLTRLTFLVKDFHTAGRATGAFADAGASKAKLKALEAARQQMRGAFHRCDGCRRWIGRECWDSSTGRCHDCGAKARGARLADAQAAGGHAAAVCPHCATPSEGGRFCAECGFDLASSHKRCPACQATAPRSARFCTDCGHGF